MKRIVIISGLSGAGKSTALGFFEDHGYFCMDNVPSVMMEQIITLIVESKVEKAAMVVDIRSEIFGDPAEAVLKVKKTHSRLVHIVFLEAAPQVIIERYALTRRKHPLGLNLERALEKEREILATIREVADEIIDTTELSSRELRSKLTAFEEKISKETPTFSFRIQSFGFKYGLPMNSEFVFDARFFPNPYYVPELKDKTGLHPEVIEFLRKFPEIDEYIERIVELLLLSKEGYKREGRSGIFVSIGCSGGKHRSVYIAEKLKRLLKERGEEVVVEHRDISKE